MELGAWKVGSNNYLDKKSPSGDKSGVPKFRSASVGLFSAPWRLSDVKNIRLAEKELDIASTSSKKTKESYSFHPKHRKYVWRT